jgi:hypothetical protein
VQQCRRNPTRSVAGNHRPRTEAEDHAPRGTDQRPRALGSEAHAQEQKGVLGRPEVIARRVKGTQRFRASGERDATAAGRGNVLGRSQEPKRLRRRKAGSSDPAGNHRACVGRTQCDRAELNHRPRTAARRCTSCEVILASSDARGTTRNCCGERKRPRTLPGTKATAAAESRVLGPGRKPSRTVLEKAGTPAWSESTALGRRGKSRRNAGHRERPRTHTRSCWDD